jgi:hypothetical protein
MLGYRFTGVTEYVVDEGPVFGTNPLEPNAVMVLRLP